MVSGYGSFCSPDGNSFADVFDTVKMLRCEQGSNLRGKIPLDFKSNALTTRPSQHRQNFLHTSVLYLSGVQNAIAERSFGGT